MIKKDFATEEELQNGIVVDGVSFSYVGVDEYETLDMDNNLITVTVFCFTNDANEIEESVYND